MKVYVVTRGWYSDYEIVAVFLNRQEAALYIATHNNDAEYRYSSFNEIEEYETQDGNIHATEDNTAGYIYSGFFSYYTNVPKFEVDRHYVVNFKNTKLDKMQVWLPEPDYEKAKKILIDRYMQEQAELQGLV